jgi:predicted  nucleic acid-binding Zn-ribbon protein
VPVFDLAECSPETPWGIHREVIDNGCPRCGWHAYAPQPEQPPEQQAN